MKKLRVTIEGKSYDVVVEVLNGGPHTAATLGATAPRVAAASVVGGASVTQPAPASLSAPSAPRAAAGLGDVLSPLAGKIVSVDVAVGAAVNEGGQVATIEAMKMNTYIYAPKSGTVAAIHIAPGDAVQEGALLLQIG